MSGFISRLGKWFGDDRGMKTSPGRHGCSGHIPGEGTYDRDTQKPVLKCSICNGEQVAGFKDLRTGKFEEAALIRNEKELEAFKKHYGIEEITKEY